MRAIVGFSLLFVWVLSLAPGHSADPTADELLKAVQEKLRVVAERAGPSVACVVVSRSEFYPRPQPPADYPGRLGGFDKTAFLKAEPNRADLARKLDISDVGAIPDHGYAGGIVIDATGMVLTTYHAIEGATKIYVHLPGGNGSYADIHAADSRSDLAVLKLLTPPAGLRPITYGDVQPGFGPDDRKATIYPGKLVTLLFHTHVTGFVLDRPSIALGLLSNVRKRPTARDDGPEQSRSLYNYANLLEYDVRLNPGCSGGALLDLDGKLIGITTSAAAVTGGENGPGYALPLDTQLRRVVDVLREGREVEYGFLGVIVNRGTNGIILSEVTPFGPAAAAGLESGDIIVGINDTPARTYEDLLLYAGSSLAGTRIKLTVSSAGRIRDVELVLAKFKNEAPWIAAVRPDPVFGLRVDWSSVLSQTLRGNRGGIGGVPPGVVIREALADSPAATKLKVLGDNPQRWLITKVNGVPTPTPADFYKASRGQQKLTLALLDPQEPNQPREITLP